MDLEVVRFEWTYASFLQVLVLVEMHIMEIRVVACGRLQVAELDPQSIRHSCKVDQKCRLERNEL